MLENILCVLSRVYAAPAPSLADVPIVGAAFLWEATMQGAADLVYHYINGHAPIVKPGAKDEKYSEASIRGLIEGVRPSRFMIVERVGVRRLGWLVLCVFFCPPLIHRCAKAQFEALWSDRPGTVPGP